MEKLLKDSSTMVLGSTVAAFSEVNLMFLHTVVVSKGVLGGIGCTRCWKVTHHLLKSVTMTCMTFRGRRTAHWAGCCCGHRADLHLSKFRNIGCTVPNVPLLVCSLPRHVLLEEATGDTHIKESVPKMSSMVIKENLTANRAVKAMVL